MTLEGFQKLLDNAFEVGTLEPLEYNHLKFEFQRIIENFKSLSNDWREKEIQYSSGPESNEAYFALINAKESCADALDELIK